MIFAGTGHRPNKLGGYSTAVFNRLVALGEAAIAKHDVHRIISGMALGWDQALAQAAVNCKIPFTATIPFEGQESMWPHESRERWRALINAADIVHTVSPGGYSARSMQTRNIWMVDKCDTVLALWNGSSGGTGNCIQYAQSINRPIINLWSSWSKHR